MIKHIVMWSVATDQRDIQCKEIKRQLEALPDAIPVIKEWEVGINFNPSEAAMDVVLYSGFESEADLETYQKHPAHQDVAVFIKSVAVKRAVVDYLA